MHTYFHVETCGKNFSPAIPRIPYSNSKALLCEAKVMTLHTPYLIDTVCSPSSGSAADYCAAYKVTTAKQGLLLIVLSDSNQCAIPNSGMDRYSQLLL
jgi:hypothetical protein